MSDDDVVEAAKKEGIDLDRKAVYRVRWDAKRKKKAIKKVAPKPAKKVTPKAIKIVTDPRELDDLLLTGPRRKAPRTAPKLEAGEAYMSALRSIVREEVRRFLSIAAES